MVLNILASYTCVVRWFKGTYMEMPVESISTCIALSGTLRNNAVYSNPIEAFMSFEDDFSKVSKSLKRKVCSFYVLLQKFLSLLVLVQMA